MKKERRSLWLGVSFLVALLGLMAGGATALILISNIWLARTVLFVGAVLAGLAFLLFPVVTIISMLTSGVRLIRREGLSLTNTLSVGFAIVYILYLVVWPLLNKGWSVNIFSYLYIYLSFCCAFTMMVFIVYTLTNMLNLLRVPGKKYSYIIVLGSGLRKGCEVTPLLAGRINKGIEAYQQNKGSVLIFSGGQGSDELIAEAEAMKAHALSQGVPSCDIITEDQSTNTKENIQFSQSLIEKSGRSSGNTLVVTTRYHVLRALLLAKEMGIACDGRGSKTKLYFSINAMVREWIAYLVLWRKPYIITLIIAFILMIGAYLYGSRGI